MGTPELQCMFKFINFNQSIVEHMCILLYGNQSNCAHQVLTNVTAIDFQQCEPSYLLDFTEGMKDISCFKKSREQKSSLKKV